MMTNLWPSTLVPTGPRLDQIDLWAASFGLGDHPGSGVAVVGSVLATRYQGHMGRALAGRHLPVDIKHTILGSFGGALAVASRVGGATGALLARAARTAFMSGLEVSFLVGAGVSLAGGVTVLVWLPSHVLPVPPAPVGERLVVLDRSALPDDERQAIVT